MHLLVDAISLPTPSLLPRLHGMPSAVLTGSCVSRSASNSGPRKSKLRQPVLRSYGNLWTSCSVRAAFQRARPSVQRRSTSSLRMKLPRCVQPRWTHLRQPSLKRQLTYRCTNSSQSLLSTSTSQFEKSSAADSVPTFVLKQIIDLIAPCIAELINRLLSTGHVPAEFKEAFITPIVKKPGSDTADSSSYRPISNLSVLSKLLERVVARQLLNYLTSAHLLPSLQYGFRPRHPTETATLMCCSNFSQLSTVETSLRWLSQTSRQHSI